MDTIEAKSIFYASKSFILSRGYIQPLTPIKELSETYKQNCNNCKKWPGRQAKKSTLHTWKRSTKDSRRNNSWKKTTIREKKRKRCWKISTKWRGRCIVIVKKWKTKYKNSSDSSMKIKTYTNVLKHLDSSRLAYCSIWEYVSGSSKYQATKRRNPNALSN